MLFNEIIINAKLNAKWGSDIKWVTI
jgi:hypothetical protein